jgi:hypothetical protein
MSRKLNLTVCVLLLSLGISNSIHAQANAPAIKHEDLATMPLENVTIEAQSITSLFSKLSLAYNIPVGLETAYNDDESVTYHIDFKKGTLRDLLTQFIDQHDQYSWEIHDGVVNIFPKDNYRDALFRDLLETKISRYSIKEGTNCLTLAKSLTDSPEVKKILEGYGTVYRERNFSGTLAPQVGQNFALDVSNVALKTLLNRVIKESPTAKFWFITRNSYDQTLFLSFSARSEYLPSKNNSSSDPQSNDQ